MDRETAQHLILLCMLSMVLITSGLAIFAFANPKEFVEWLQPLHWLSRKFSTGKSTASMDQILSWSIGSLNLFVLALIWFVLGGWFVTVFLHLWGSPISRWVLPYP